MQRLQGSCQLPLQEKLLFDWIQPNGESPICDSYEVRLTKLLDTFTRTGSKDSVADIHRALEKEFESKHDGDCSRGGQGPDGARSHD
jgi:hypothetical protein